MRAGVGSKRIERVRLAADASARMATDGAAVVGGSYEAADVNRVGQHGFCHICGFVRVLSDIWRLMKKKMKSRRKDGTWR